MEAKNLKEHRRLLKASCIRRSEQGRGARSPDLITPTHWWFELNDSAAPVPLNKLDQAERDIRSLATTDNPWVVPAVIWHRKASPTINVTLRANAFLRTFNSRPKYLPPVEAHVTLDFEHFAMILALQKAAGELL